MSTVTRKHASDHRHEHRPCKCHTHYAKPRTCGLVDPDDVGLVRPGVRVDGGVGAVRVDEARAVLGEQGQDLCVVDWVVI